MGKKIKLDQIRTDGGTQPRAELDSDIIDEYRERMEDGDKFPPVELVFDGKTHWIWDGFHRYFAATRAGALDIDANVRQGTQRDAILLSLGANGTHGQRRTNEDKRRAVERMLEDEEWGKWSDRKIADKCGVSHELVRQVRPSLSTVDSEPRTYTTKHGTTATMDTANIGKSKPKTESSEEIIDGDTGAVVENPIKVKTTQGVKTELSEEDQEQREREHAEADARSVTLKRLVSVVDWIERYTGPADDNWDWFWQDGPGQFEHGLTAERIKSAAKRLALWATDAPKGERK